MSFKNLKMRKDLDRILIYHWAYFIPGIIAEITWPFLSYKFSFSIIVFVVLFYVSLKMLRSLYYSFWTFSLINFFVLFFSLVKCYFLFGTNTVFYLYLLSILLLLIEFYALHTPIYYPLVNWWEYDFRFRSDLKITVSYVNNGVSESAEGRLTDLRKRAGCVVTFEELNIGDFIEIKPMDEFKHLNLNAEIVSKRTSIPGRGIHYGVRFILDSKLALDTLDEFVLHWAEQRKLKRKMRFQKEKAQHDKVYD